MRLCLDTRFLFSLAQKNKKHEDMFESFYKGIHRVVLPTVCIAEFVSRAHVQGKNNQEIMEVVDKFTALKRSQLLFNIEGLSIKVALEAGRLQHSYDLGLGDSIVAATAITKKCDFILTDDRDFDIVKKLIKKMF